mgnify:CR=1 FL=1
MNHAITMGIFWHLIGAASAACFYAPFKKVRQWSWETMWSVGGVVSWILLPWAISAMLLPDFWGYFSSFNASTLLPVFLFGAMWGIGNINYGLTMRYLGMSMGIGIAIGITLIVGTLMTPILNGNLDVLLNTEGGRMTLLGVLVAVIGVGIVTRAGQLKERKMGIKAEDFNLKKGSAAGGNVRHLLRRNVVCHERRQTDARGGSRAGRRPAVRGAAQLRGDHGRRRTG